MSKIFSFSLLILVFLLAACEQPLTTREKGTLAGAAIGSGLGAIVGHQTGNAGAGTAIGGGIGAVSGALIGNSMGNTEARQSEQDERLRRQEEELRRQRREIEELRRERGRSDDYDYDY
ncbi:MAG: hypothetical protein J5J00_03300 [Deltaproteobacteria bacterium]|nr:hypothetical protein [Deltaproteobacteria bacterium]